MTLSRFTPPVLDVGSGIKPSDGAQLFFTNSNTLADEDTFNAQDGLTPNANPVIADANGVFPDIYLSPVEYKVVLQDKNNVQKGEWDPVSSFVKTGGSEFVKNFGTLAEAIADAGLVDGDSIKLEERSTGNGGGACWKAVLTSSVTPNTFNIVQCTGIVTLSLVLITNGPLNVRQWGAVGDGVTDDILPIQAAVDSLGLTTVLDVTGGSVFFPHGHYLITVSIKLKSSWIRLFGENEFSTKIEYNGTTATAAIQIGADMAQTTIYSYNQVDQLAIKVVSAGSYGIQYDKCQYASFKTLVVQLSAANQVAFHGKGNGDGSGPYYNNFDNLVVIGSVDATQVAFGFYLNSSDTLDAPNGNMFSNIKRIASVGVAFDLEVGQANNFVNIGMENISERGFRFSNVSARASGTATSGTANVLTDTGASFPTLSNGTLVITGGTGNGTVASIKSNGATTVTLDQSLSFVMDSTTQYEVYDGRCSNNKAVNVRHEGTNTTILFENLYGGNQNVISNLFTTGATKRWENTSLDSDSSFATLSGQLVPVTFQVSNLAANTTTKMTPAGGVSLSISGGWRPQKASFIESVSTAVDSFFAAGLGNATIKTFVSGSQQTDLDHTINVNNRFGFTRVAPDTGTVLKNQSITVQITTDAAWDQTTCDMTVVVWVIC